MELPLTLPAWLISLLFGSLVMVIVVLIFPEPHELSDDGVVRSAARRQSKSILFKLFLPLILLIAQFVELLPLEKHRAKLELRLIQAGRPGGVTASEYDATRIITIVLALLAGMFFDSELGLSPICTLGLGALGFMYPDIWLKDVIATRRRRIFRDLPDILDTLRLAVDAGFDLSSAMQVVVERGRRGPLLDELELVAREVSLGRTRQQAFRNFADRIAMAEINAFVVALNQADQLGASIGPVLKAQADMSRTRRWQLAEALVNKIPMKMLAPLVIFIFPSSFIILFTPLLIQWMQS
ncbi:MAG: type II secretion system F family protein [Bdellovibrionales bacterium]|nr:type II secretion system F family protein [Bdellovibrionales bacterium]